MPSSEHCTHYKMNPAVWDPPVSCGRLSTGAPSQCRAWTPSVARNNSQPRVCISSRHFICLVSDTHSCTGNLSNHFWIKVLGCCASERCMQPSVCSEWHLCISTRFHLSQHHSLSPTCNLPVLMIEYSVHVQSQGLASACDGCRNY